MSYEAINNYYVSQRGALVKRYTFRTGSEAMAEDIVQEAFTRALKYVDSYNPDKLIDQWMSTILNNAFKHYMNQERGYVPVYEDGDEEVEDEEGYEEGAVYLISEVLEYISTKPPAHQEVLNLYFKQMYSPRDISEITEHKYKSVHQIIRRFLKELKGRYG